MSEIIAWGSLSIFIMFMVYISLKTCIDRYKITFGHEASFILVIGMILSFLLEQLELHELLMKFLKFNENLFFYICLPPIVFSSGFNMHRGDFFANFKMVLTLGVFATFVCFTIFSGLTILAKENFTMRYIDGSTGKWGNLDLQNQEILLMCSLLCSSDVIAAVSLVSYDKEPALYSIIFGEGITNDAVSIILFNTVMRYTGAKSNKIDWTTPVSITYMFTMLGFWSLVIGILFGLISSWLLKKYRAFSKNPITETTIIFCIGYIAYIVSEFTENSGIISLLTCGITMSHYTWFNLSPQGKHASYIVFEFLGFGMEGFVFIYLGVTLFSFGNLRWSPDLFFIELIIIIIGRFIGTVGFLKLLSLCGFKNSLNFKQQIFVWFAGMIRGAIAFGLVLRISPSFANRDVIVTTSLTLVIFTTVVFGSVLGSLQQCLMPDSKDKDEELEEDTPFIDEQKQSQTSSNWGQKDSNQNEEDDTKIQNANASQKQSHLQKQMETMDAEEMQRLQYGVNNYQKKFNIQDEDADDNSFDASVSSEYSEEDILHPNFQANEKGTKRVYKGCSKYLHRFDELIMKPIFIYKYEKNMIKKSEEFFHLYKQQGQKIEQNFTNEAMGIKKQKKKTGNQDSEQVSVSAGQGDYSKKIQVDNEDEEFKDEQSSSFQGSQGMSASYHGSNYRQKKRHNVDAMANSFTNRVQKKKKRSKKQYEPPTNMNINETVLEDQDGENQDQPQTNTLNE